MARIFVVFALCIAVSGCSKPATSGSSSASQQGASASVVKQEDAARAEEQAKSDRTTNEPVAEQPMVFRSQSITIPKIVREIPKPEADKSKTVELKFKPMTAHVAIPGGDGPGYNGGRANAKVRFVRLEYSGGDWDQGFGVTGDVNLLVQYGAQTNMKVAEQTESRTIEQLGRFKANAAPPVVYLTGKKSISLEKSEVKILRDYLLDRHGMLFIDNGGSSIFHTQAFAMMRSVVPEIEPVKIPLDDFIHRAPNQLEYLPYIAPHGGRDAWGWKHDGRWICYYHPGNLGAAWSDGHAGVKQQVWEACYGLGVNIISYAYSENAKWRSVEGRK